METTMYRCSPRGGRTERPPAGREAPPQLAEAETANELAGVAS